MVRFVKINPKARLFKENNSSEKSSNPGGSTDLIKMTRLRLDFILSEKLREILTSQNAGNNSSEI